MTQIQLIFTKHILLLPSRLYCHCERSEAISSCIHIKTVPRIPLASPHVTPILLFNLTVALTLLTLLLLKIVLPQNKRQAFRPAFVLHAYLIDGKHSMPAVREHPLQRQKKLLRPQSEI